MEKNNITDVILGIIFILIICIIITNRCHRVEPDCTHIVDTVTTVDTIWDTVTIREPVVHTKTVKDTILVPRDTILYREQLSYVDTSYKAWVSGINPQLDSIYVFNPTITQEQTIYDTPVKTVVKQPWVVGNIGVGLGYDGNNIIPFVGINVGININKLIKK